MDQRNDSSCDFFPIQIVVIRPVPGLGGTKKPKSDVFVPCADCARMAICIYEHSHQLIEMLPPRGLQSRGRHVIKSKSSPWKSFCRDKGTTLQKLFLFLLVRGCESCSIFDANTLFVGSSSQQIGKK